MPTQTTRTGAGTAARARLRDDADMPDQQDSRSHITWRSLASVPHCATRQRNEVHSRHIDIIDLRDDTEQRKDATSGDHVSLQPRTIRSRQ
jgi:hypothetical protein